MKGGLPDGEDNTRCATSACAAKDCLCLYVCPTGATDTENSVIDVNTCIGCGDCADACPFRRDFDGTLCVSARSRRMRLAWKTALLSLMRSKSEQETHRQTGLPGSLAAAD